MRFEIWRFVPGYNAIQGEIFGHPNYYDGEVIITSNIVSFDRAKMEVKTRTGSIYRLGAPNQDLQNQIDDIERYLNGAG
jgi:hypothetical protein